MNEENIERLLRKAPRPQVPPGLLERIEANISLPGRRVEAIHRSSSPPWFRRWLPAYSLGVVLLACAVLVAQQAATVSQLRKAGQTVAEAKRPAETSGQPRQTVNSLRPDIQELERLRKENLEVQNLRLEVAQLRDRASRLAQVLAENEKLRTDLVSLQNGGGVGELGKAVEEARAKAESIRCVNNLKNIGLAARIFATDNGDMYPPDFLSMKNELATPKILHCSSDLAKPEAPDWSQFGPGNSSYEFLSPGLKSPDPSVVLARCSVHGHVCMADGSVQQNPEKYGAQIVLKDGKYLLVRPQTQPAPQPSPQFQPQPPRQPTFE